MHRTTALLLLLACACDREPPRERLGEPVSPHTLSERRMRMHERFESVDLARTALVRGDLEQTRTIASTLQFRFTVDLPPAVRHLGDEVSRGARDVAAAEDLDTAALAYGRLLASCGGCHGTAEVRWSWATPPLPAGEDLSARMQRHAWAGERMWESLLHGDQARFDEAVAILEAAPFSGEPAPDFDVPAGTRALEERIREAARSARSNRTIEERAATYGNILGACGGCHRLIREADLAPLREL